MASEEVRDGLAGGFEMTVVATTEPGQVRVRLKGELDIASVPTARERIADLRDRASEVILDLRELSFIDSTGLNLVLQLAAESSQDGWALSLIPGSSVVQRVFQLTGTEQRLPFQGLPENQSARHGPSGGRGRWLRP